MWYISYWIPFQQVAVKFNVYTQKYKLRMNVSIFMLRPPCFSSAFLSSFTRCGLVFVPTIPPQCLLAISCVVIVASTFLAPSLALSFKMLCVLYFSERCFFFSPWSLSVVSCFSEGQITANSHQWLVEEGAVCPVHHPVTLFHSSTVVLLQRLPGPSGFLPSTPKDRGCIGNLNLTSRVFLLMVLLKCSRYSGSESKQLKISSSSSSFPQAAPSQLLVFQVSAFIVHYQNKHFWLLSSKSPHQNTLWRCFLENWLLLLKCTFIREL